MYKHFSEFFTIWYELPYFGYELPVSGQKRSFFLFFSQKIVLTFAPQKVKYFKVRMYA
jgi:hypothetical protein